MSTRRAGGRSRSKSRSRRGLRGGERGLAEEVFVFSGTEADFVSFVERAFEVSCSKESLLEQEALLATEYAPFVEERYTWSSKLHAREAARFRTAHLTGVQPEALVFPAQGVPFVPLAADLQEAAPGALALRRCAGAHRAGARG